ncbi:permease [bacterium]|nr:permease [bacterium]
MDKCECSTTTPKPNRFFSRPIAQQVILLILLVALFIFLYLETKPFAEWMTYSVLGFSRTSLFGSALAFILYDVPKVFLLLTGVIFLIGILRSFVTPEQTRKVLHQRNLLWGHGIASLLGIVSPFCTCSTIPLFIGFVESGIPLGVTFSFLISSPLIDEVALVLLLGMFGWKVAGLYLLAGLLISFFTGILIGKMNLENEVEDWVQALRSNQEEEPSTQKMSWPDRLAFASKAVQDIVSKVWIYILIGILIGAFIHGYVPESFLTNIMGKKAWWSVPVAVLLGIPMYSNAAGIIPVFEALIGKGAALGTVLAFMMAVIGLSLPEGIILRKVLKPKLIAIYFTIVGVSIIFTGLLFNIII